jgi:hypothetical protein
LVSNAVGRTGNNGSVGGAGDTSVGLRVCHRDAVGDVDTDGSFEISITYFEGTVLSIVGHVVRAANLIVSVLAVCRLVCTGGGGITDGEAKLVPTDEAVPVHDLLESVVVPIVAREGVRVHQATKRVATQVGTVRVKLSSVVTGLHVDLSLVDEAGELDILASLENLYTLQDTLWDETGPPTTLGTPCDFLLFRVTNSRVWLRRSPKTEIGDTVHHQRLTHGLLVLSGRVTDVETDLRATNSVGDVVDLVRDAGRVGILLVGEWGRVSWIRLSEGF